MAARPDVISLAQSEPVLLSSDSRKSPRHFKLVFPALNFPLDRDVKFRATSEFVNYRRHYRLQLTWIIHSIGIITTAQ